MITSDLKIIQSPAISLESVWHCYSNSADNRGLFIPRWTLHRGQRVFLYGESGSGKTTLLNLLAGVLTPAKGTVKLLEQEFSALSSRRRDQFRARHIGVVFQQFNLISYLSVVKNIQLAAYFAGESTKDLELRATELLVKLRLSPDVAQRRASELSVGQQQRVAIARALINSPEILLVDEPTSALDAAARDAFMEILIEMCDLSKTTLIFVSHDQSLQRYFETRVAMSSLCQPTETSVC